MPYTSLSMSRNDEAAGFISNHVMSTQRLLANPFFSGGLCSGALWRAILNMVQYFMNLQSHEMPMGLLMLYRCSVCCKQPKCMMFAVMMQKTSFPTAVYCNCLKGSEIESEDWRAADRTEQHGNKKIRWNGSELCRGNETKQNEPFWCASGLGWAVVACPACDRPRQGEEPGQKNTKLVQSKDIQRHCC